MNRFLILTGLLILFSCGGGEKKKTNDSKKDTTNTTDTIFVSEDKKEFYCTVNGEEFTFDERHCTRRPDFNKYDFSFLGNASVNIMFDFSCEKKTVPFTVEIPAGKQDDAEARILYDKPPTPYGITVNTNKITVTDWDTVNHTISLEFSGKLTDIDKSGVIDLEGYLNKMPYDYFK